jgi:hypothetical protein
MPNHLPIPRLLILISVAMVLLISAAGQSGRRARKPATEPAPTPAATPTIAKPVEKPKPSLTVIVGMDTPDFYMTSNSPNPSSLLLSVVDRLEAHPLVRVASARAHMTRGDAVGRAKAEKEAFIVYVKLANLSMMRGSSDNTQFAVQYWVFTPTTAKVKTSGQTYLHAYRNRGVILNPRVPGLYGDPQLQQAGREAADRILDAFKLSSPDRRFPGQAGADVSASE